MASNVEDVSIYSFGPNDKVLFDTNIWMYLFAPQSPNDRKVSTYSQAFAQIRSAGSKIHIDGLILCEFINAYSRLLWNTNGRPFGDFKKFRKTQVFTKFAGAIAADAQRLMRYCTRLDGCFETVDTSAMLTEYAVGDSDFNDQMIAELCRSRNLTLITHDADFKGKDLSILTANSKLLA